MAKCYAEEISRNFRSRKPGAPMDEEGLDLAILFRLCDVRDRAHQDGPALCSGSVPRLNDWLHEYIDAAADPKTMCGAAAVSPHEVESGIAETRRAVTELGMKAIFLRPNFYNDRPWHDRYHDPLWAAGQELNVPIGFHETAGSA